MVRVAVEDRVRAEAVDRLGEARAPEEGGDLERLALERLLDRRAVHRDDLADPRPELAEPDLEEERFPDGPVDEARHGLLAEGREGRRHG